MRTILGLLLIASQAFAGSYHVTTTGYMTGRNGSISQPWSIRGALADSNNVCAAGDTLWIHGGDYLVGADSLGLLMTWGGDATHQTLVRNYNNERVRLIGVAGWSEVWAWTKYGTNIDNTILRLEYNVDYVTVWGMEFMSNANFRTSDSLFRHHPYNHDFPAGFRRQPGWGDTSHAVKLINCLFIGLGEGFDAGALDVDVEVYGCLFLDIGAYVRYADSYGGTASPDSGEMGEESGYAHYWQGSSKTTSNCVYGGNVWGSYAMHAYTEGSSTAGMTVDSAIAVGVGSVMLLGNAYTSLTGNHVYGIYTNFGTGSFDHQTLFQNRFVSRNGNQLAVQLASSVTNSTVSGNYVVGTITGADSLGGDATGTFLSSYPATGDTAFVYPNKYEPTRANIAVYNWTQSDSATVNVSAAYSDGDTLLLRNGQDYWGDSTYTAVVASGVIKIPMSASRWTPKVFQAYNYDTWLYSDREVGPESLDSSHYDSTEVNSFPRFGAFLATLYGAATGGETGDVAPTVTTDPTGGTTRKGLTRTFTVEASGTTSTYQWQKNGTNITGATSASYTTPAVTIAEHGAQFRCIVSNAAGSDTSAAATLTVQLARKMFGK